MGVGDLGVGIRVKHMAKSFYGRVAAYDAGLAAYDSDPAPLTEALRRNVYGTLDDAAVEADWLAALARYQRQADQNLAALPEADLTLPPRLVWPDAAALRHG